MQQATLTASHIVEQGSSSLAQSDRWQMHRAGILNFWYYDEEEFQLEDGRLILRGSNGSGKSVTMQSFLPLVLDGDKRAHRLDPFGSRDRRIEYYLLGEDDQGKGKTDSIGYLWLEFRHMRTGSFKTIGIGLRARRNAAQVQFWGFVIEDGRRIGQHMWLYNRNRWIEDNVRLPFDRKELEAAIGAGGQVVQDQKSYQQMVNKHIFGFSDIEAYQDLLQLMIQLRSPKLSKDFKPSAIYEILHQALPPLMEDELRPLSEVLEDMDQMTDRLDEIRRQHNEISKLQDKYDLYNKHILLSKADDMLGAKSEYDESAVKVQKLQAELAQATEERQRIEQDRKEMAHKLQELMIEKETLEQHEAIGKQKELEAAVIAVEDIERQLERTNDKLHKERIKLNRLKQEAEHKTAVKLKAEREQLDLLEELEAMAGDVEFAEHAIYHRYWNSSIPEDESWKDAWRTDIRKHRERVEQALLKAVKEREAAEMVKDSELELGEASLARDEAERERNMKEKLLEEEKEALKDELRAWHSSLRLLGFSLEDMSATFGLIREFGEEQSAFEQVRQPLLQRYAADQEALMKQRVDIEARQEALQEQHKLLVAEKQAWEQSREPEPERSKARAAYREKSSRKGAPLYEVCRFQPHVSEEMQARVEEALERSGLLDAWISPDGSLGNCESDQEEAWIIPDPIEFGYTLADMLQADLPAETELTEQIVHDVLRSFWWDEDGSLMGEAEWKTAVAGDGSYRAGALLGKTNVKTRAEFIGKETRKRTRLLEIAKLEQKIKEIEEQLAEIRQQLQQHAAKTEALQAERDAYPDGQKLRSSLKQLQAAGYKLQSALAQEERALRRFKAKSEEWRVLQVELHDLTAGWTTLKREKQLSEAMQTIREYESALSELSSFWRQHKDAQDALLRVNEDLEMISNEIEDEELLADELDARRRKQRAQAEALRRIVEELGLEDLARRLEQIRNESEKLLMHENQQSKALDAVKEQLAQVNARLDVQRDQEAERSSRLQAMLQQLEQELARGLVAEWKEEVEALQQISDQEKSVLKQMQALAKKIKEQYEALFARRNNENIANSMLMQFNTARMMLTEFVLQTVNDESSGRIIVLSMRNPQQPLSPQHILQELKEQEAEQSLLLSERDRELYEEIILRSVGKAIRQRIHRAEQWVRDMNKLMEERNTSSGLRLKLEWDPKSASVEHQLDVYELVELLKRDSHRLREDEIDAMIQHFRSQIQGAKQAAQAEQESLRLHLYRVLDYRNWFQFELKYKKGEEAGYRPLTDARFNVMSGGEKAMAMYIPLFAATSSRYSDARQDAPKIISLDEAFAGVDEENMRDLFKLLTDMGFDYIMTSQVLWGCYDTVPRLAIYEIYRPKDVDFITLFRYRWNGKRKEYVEAGYEQKGE